MNIHKFFIVFLMVNQYLCYIENYFLFYIYDIKYLLVINVILNILNKN